MAELNDIKIDLGELRKNIAELQKLGFNEVGLEDLLKFIYAYRHSTPLKDALRTLNRET